jgi:hypothetical protein
MRTLLLALICTGVLLGGASVVSAGLNAGCTAYISWSQTTLVTDAPPAAVSNAFLIVSTGTASPLSFKGGEADITWEPATGCFTHSASFFSTSSNCLWLNRGSNVPVTTIDDPGHYHVAWANTLVNSTCANGTGVRIQFDTSLCSGGGCLALNSFLCLDANGAVDNAIITNGILTIGGGGGHNCGVTPAEPATWGRIKGLYRS